MEWVKVLLSFIKELFIPVAAYKAGKNSKELDQVKDENKKLKEYKEIDEEEVVKKEVYTSKEWV